MKTWKWIVSACVFIFFYTKFLGSDDQPKFETWKTIKIGEYKSADGYLREFVDEAFAVTPHAVTLLRRRVEYAQEVQEIKLIRTTVAKIGFPSGFTKVSEVYKRVKEIGSVLPAEAAPALRLQYRDQSYGETMYILAEPINWGDNGGDNYIFEIERYQDQLWLDTLSTDFRYFGPNVVIVFMAPK